MKKPQTNNIFNFTFLFKKYFNIHLWHNDQTTQVPFAAVLYPVKWVFPS